MGGSRGDADCFRARDTDFTQMIARAGIGNDCFSALSIARIGHDGAAAQHNRRDAIEGRTRGESDAAIILLENVAVVNGSDFSHENVDLALTTFGLMNYDDRGKNNFGRPVGVAPAKSNTALTSILSR